MTNFFDYVEKKLTITNNEWETDPFPHIVIDNFLPEDIFSKITNTIISNEKNFKDVKTIYNTPLEFEKKTYNDSDLNEYLKIPIEILGGTFLKKCIKKIIGDIELISLSDIKNYGGYSPFHIMKNNGFLGSHIDHSRSTYGDFHIANSIFYASPKWKSDNGGETILFNKSGLKIRKFISPKPNRLIIFLHTAESFHGVNTISCDNDTKRYTYYMDYYIKEKNLENNNYNLKIKNFSPTYCDHNTTFIPAFPLGLKSFKIKSLFNFKTYYPYLFSYLKYFINKKFNKINIS